MLWATNKNRFLPCSALAQCVPHCNLLSYTEDTLVFMALSLSYSSGRNALLWEHAPGTSPRCLKQRSWCQSKRSDFILCHPTEGQGSAWRALWGLRAVQSWVGESRSGHSSGSDSAVCRITIRGLCMHAHTRSHVLHILLITRLLICLAASFSMTWVNRTKQRRRVWSSCKTADWWFDVFYVSLSQMTFQ